MLGGLQRG